MTEIDEEVVRLRLEIEGVRAAPLPQTRVVVPQNLPARRLGTLAVLPGAFNPPTFAHLALARAAVARGFDRVLLSLGTTTLDKEEHGLALEDRLWLLTRIAQGDPRCGVVLQNRGLYAEMAEAVRRSFPDLADLAFVAGMDKVPQLFEARYYDDLSQGLETLFSRARFVVAPRGSAGRVDLENLLATPVARRFAHRFDWLELAPRWRTLSATAVRDRLERDEHVEQWLPPVVAAFVRESGAFREPDRYAARIARLRART